MSGDEAAAPIDVCVMTDAELWALSTSTNPDAFGLIFDRHVSAVHRYCARRTGSLDAADDLVSIVFLEAWRRRAAVVLESDTALPWLLGIARMTLRRRARTAVRHRRAIERLPHALFSPNHADDVIDILDGRARAADVMVAFRRLGPIDQDVIALCLWQGLDYASAAVALGVPIGTVRSRLSRARGRLVTLLAPTSPFQEN